MLAFLPPFLAKTDVLTQFQVPAKPAPPPEPSSSSSKAASGPSQTGFDDSLIPPEISDEFEAGLEELLRQLTFPPSEAAAGPSGKDAPKSDTKSAGGEDTEDTKEFRRLWEKMMAEGMSGVDDGQVPNEEYDKVVEKAMAGIFESKERLSVKRETAAPKASKEGSSSDSYQEAIRKTMDKLKSSDESNKVRAPFVLCILSDSKSFLIGCQ